MEKAEKEKTIEEATASFQAAVDQISGEHRAIRVRPVEDMSSTDCILLADSEFGLPKHPVFKGGDIHASIFHDLKKSLFGKWETLYYIDVTVQMRIDSYYDVAKMEPVILADARWKKIASKTKVRFAAGKNPDSALPANSLFFYFAPYQRIPAKKLSSALMDCVEAMKVALEILPRK